MTRTSSIEQHHGQISGVDSFQEALTVPHLFVTLPRDIDLESIETTLADACCGLLQGERPSVFVDRKKFVAVIPIPPDRVERVLYKSYIIHKPTDMRYKCTFRGGSSAVQMQKRLSIELPGAKFAWLKAQTYVRDRLYSYEPLIRVNWQQLTGSATCKIHLHYSSEGDEILREVYALHDWILAEADKIIVRSFPLYVPPRNRFGLSNDSKFREIAYNHHVSLWTRTLKDSPLGNEWCTLATDDLESMEATLEAYREYGMTTKWGSKSPQSQSPPSSSPLLRSPSTEPASPLALSTSPTSAVSPSHIHVMTSHNSIATTAVTTAPAGGAPGAVDGAGCLPPGLDLPNRGFDGAAPTALAPPASMSPFSGFPYASPARSPVTYGESEKYSAAEDAWGKFLLPTDFVPAAASAASLASTNCWTQLISTPSIHDDYVDPQMATRYLSLTDSHSG